jgi:hypothetical protein
LQRGYRLEKSSLKIGILSSTVQVELGQSLGGKEETLGVVVNKVV